MKLNCTVKSLQAFTEYAVQKAVEEYDMILQYTMHTYQVVVLLGTRCTLTLLMDHVNGSKCKQENVF